MKKIALLCLAVLGFFTAKAQLEWAPMGAKYYYSFYDESNVSSVRVVEVVDEIMIAGKICRRFSSSFVLGAFCPGMYLTYEEDGQ